MKHVLLCTHTPVPRGYQATQQLSCYTQIFLSFLLGGTSVFSLILSPTSDKRWWQITVSIGLEAAAEAGLCPVNVNQVVYRIKYLNDWRNIFHHQWRTLCAQTFQFFALYCFLCSTSLAWSHLLNFSFETGTPMFWKYIKNYIENIERYKN